MNKQGSVDKIIEILKKGALKFSDAIDTNLKCCFTEKKEMMK